MHESSKKIGLFIQTFHFVHEAISPFWSQNGSQHHGYVNFVFSLMFHCCLYNSEECHKNYELCNYVTQHLMCTACSELTSNIDNLEKFNRMI